MIDNQINSQYYAEIVVSNTFTQEWEMEEYHKLAEKYGYMVFSIIVENRHGGINEHNVPEEKLEQMKHRFQISL
jgi:50S ribosomal subunit-associated GTPase HflX